MLIVGVSFMDAAEETVMASPGVATSSSTTASVAPTRKPGPKAPGSSSAASTPRSNMELETRRRTVRRTMFLGLWIWPLFTLLDAYMCFVLYPSAPFPLFIAYRAGLEAFILWVYRSALRPDADVVVLERCQNLAFFLAVLAVALMAIHFDGLRSSYMHGISIACLIRAAATPEHRRRCAVTFAAYALVFPAVMGAAMLISSAARAAWR